jgi:pectinesterase
MQGLKKSAVLVLMLTAFAMGADPTTKKTSFTVSPDGSGDYKTVLAAVNAAPQLTSFDQPFEIHVKPGTYKELIYVQREKRFIKLIGEDPEKTVITFNLYAGMKGPDGNIIGTFRTPTVYIDADDFTCENLTFENSAGRVGQALAIRIDGDRMTFRNCRFLGWQDTILGNRGRHYFENCYIAGATDFIFGAATEWYENCEIHCLGNGYITAASTEEATAFGFVFSHCKITAESPEVKTFLGRPWRAFAATTFLNTEMPDCIRPEGWNNWGRKDREKTARYAEFNSSGAGGKPDSRAPWSKQLSKEDGESLTIEKVFGDWRPNR